MKKLLFVFGVLAVLAGVAVWFVATSIGSIAKAGIESVGSEATQTRVRVRDVEFSATSGSGEIRDLVVGNPKGFATDSAMKFGIVRVVVDTDTLRSDPIVIREIVIEAPQITYEVGTGATNIGAIQANVQAFARRLGSGGSGGSGDDDGPGIVIEDLFVRRGRVSVSATFLGGREVGADLEEIHLTNIGKAEGGATAGEIAAQVIGAISRGTLSAVGGIDVPGLRESLLEQGKRAAGDALKSILGE